MLTWRRDCASDINYLLEQSLIIGWHSAVLHGTISNLTNCLSLRKRSEWFNDLHRQGEKLRRDVFNKVIFVTSTAEDPIKGWSNTKCFYNPRTIMRYTSETVTSFTSAVQLRRRRRPREGRKEGGGCRPPTDWGKGGRGAGGRTERLLEGNKFFFFFLIFAWRMITG